MQYAIRNTSYSICHSIDLLYLSQVIGEDGIDQALPMPQLVSELRCSTVQAKIIEAYRKQEQRLTACYLNTTYMEEWFIIEIK